MRDTKAKLQRQLCKWIKHQLKDYNPATSNANDFFNAYLEITYNTLNFDNDDDNDAYKDILKYCRNNFNRSGDIKSTKHNRKRSMF